MWYAPKTARPPSTPTLSAPRDRDRSDWPSTDSRRLARGRHPDVRPHRLAPLVGEQHVPQQAGLAVRFSHVTVRAWWAFPNWSSRTSRSERRSVTRFSFETGPTFASTMYRKSPSTVRTPPSRPPPSMNAWAAGSASQALARRSAAIVWKAGSRSGHCPTGSVRSRSSNSDAKLWRNALRFTPGRSVGRVWAKDVSVAHLARRIELGLDRSESSAREAHVGRRHRRRRRPFRYGTSAGEIDQ